MKRIAKLFAGIIIGSIAGIAATIIFSPKKRTEWFDEIQDRTQNCPNLIKPRKNIKPKWNAI